MRTIALRARVIFDCVLVSIVVALLSISLVACSPGGGVQSAIGAVATIADTAGAAAPGQLANRTVADEQALLALELAYKLARTAGELALDAGVIKGPRAQQLADADNQAFLALTLARSVYATGNADSWRQALDEGNQTVAAILPLLKGDPQ